VDRAALPDLGRDRPILDVPYAAPRTELEATLAGIWAEMLGLVRVGVDDDFLDLGGHSLVAASLVLRIRDRLAVDIPAASLFQASTVAGQAVAILERSAGALPGARLDRVLGEPSFLSKEIP
jgi:acyl carrier protein